MPTYQNTTVLAEHKMYDFPYFLFKILYKLFCGPHFQNKLKGGNLKIKTEIIHHQV